MIKFELSYSKKFKKLLEKYKITKKGSEGFMKYVDTWDLDSIFPGGTKSKEVQEKLASVEKEIEEYKKELQAWDYTGDEDSVKGLKDLLAKQETIGKGLGQVRTFARMWLDAYMDDEYGGEIGRASCRERVYREGGGG